MRVKVPVVRRGLGGRTGVSVQKVLGEDGHTLRGEVRREGHADARCGPWHPGMLHTCALEQPDSRGHRLRFQLRHTGLPWWLGALAYVGVGTVRILGPAGVVLGWRADPPVYKGQSAVLWYSEVQMLHWYDGRGAAVKALV